MINYKSIIGPLFWEIFSIEILIKRRPVRRGRPQSQQQHEAVATANELGKIAYGPQQDVISEIKNFVGSRSES